MKLRSKIAVNRMVGLPLASVLNLAARILGKLMPGITPCRERA